MQTSILHGWKSWIDIVFGLQQVAVAVAGSFSGSAGDRRRHAEPPDVPRRPLRCVCRQWRLAAEQQEPLLPPAFPWLATSSPGVFVSLPDGAHHRLPTPDAIAGITQPRAAEAFDDWLLFKPQTGEGYDTATASW